LLDFIVGAVERKRMLTGAHHSSGRCTHRPAFGGICTPMVIRWLANCLFDVAGHTPDTKLDEFEVDASSDELLQPHRSLSEASPRKLHDAGIC
jgi:hypothetical protein